MAITTWANVQAILELAAAKQTLVNALIPQIEADYQAIRNKPFDIGKTLTVTGAPSSDGNIKVTLGDYSFYVAVENGDSVELVARKIKVEIGSTFYYSVNGVDRLYDITVVGAVLTFKNKYSDTELTITFEDTDTTATTATVSQTQIIYPDGSEMTAIQMINWRLQKIPAGVTSDKLGDFSQNFESGGGIYPAAISRSIKKFASWK